MVFGSSLRIAAAGCAAAILLSSGCTGSNPVSPASPVAATPPPGLRLGPNLVHLAGAAAVADGNGPLRTTCTPGAGPTGGMLHWSSGVVQRDGEAWRFDGGQPAGSMVLHFRVGALEGREAPASGSFRASSVDTGWGSLFQPSGVRAEVSDATFQGQLSSGPGLRGRLTGTIVFIGADGTRATCSEVSLLMSPGMP